ncbi:hypothetical protein L202_02553 [Cryptococcus amylolentus CBS 6039]|uniref:Uncharacterized protein n=1 Tax=Cryptococcus amylolentus CBS 6039 TaxID=1295533 RepID=A0A1E3I335_9TREE|nr:hypothetical protein L202_02553 [Cryptococcus amylolentus CBS 6039]ODN82271.1 hypothetical protein L202_02553 [Cryptococcus amylolentus CBS 6039]
MADLISSAFEHHNTHPDQSIKSVTREFDVPSSALHGRISGKHPSNADSQRVTPSPFPALRQPMLTQAVGRLRLLDLKELPALAIRVEGVFAGYAVVEGGGRDIELSCHRLYALIGVRVVMLKC